MDTISGNIRYIENEVIRAQTEPKEPFYKTFTKLIYNGLIKDNILLIIAMIIINIGIIYINKKYIKL